MTNQQKKVIIGRFGAPFGVKGWIKVNYFTEPPTNIFDYKPWFLQTDTGWEPLTIEANKILGTKPLVRIMGCEDRDQASWYTYHDICIDQSILPKVPKGEYYWSDLIGLQVINQDHTELGVVDHLMETGANDVLVVKNDRTRLIPYISHVILEVDLTKRRVIVDWDPEF